MNSSIGALATFLLGYRDFVQDLINAKGEDAFLNGEYGEDELAELRQNWCLSIAVHSTAGRSGARNSEP
jgi:hypothetical protein